MPSPQDRAALDDMLQPEKNGTSLLKRRPPTELPTLSEEVKEQLIRGYLAKGEEGREKLVVSMVQPLRMAIEHLRDYDSIPIDEWPACLEDPPETDGFLKMWERVKPASKAVLSKPFVREVASLIPVLRQLLEERHGQLMRHMKRGPTYPTAWERLTSEESEPTEPQSRDPEADR